MSKSTTGRKLLDDLEKRVAELERKFDREMRELRYQTELTEAKRKHPGLAAKVDALPDA